MDPPLGRKHTPTNTKHLRSRQNPVTYNDSTQAKLIAQSQMQLQNYYNQKFGPTSEPPRPKEYENTAQTKWFSFLCEQNLEELTEAYVRHLQTFRSKPSADVLDRAIKRFNETPLILEEGHRLKATLLSDENDPFPVIFTRDSRCFGPRYQRARLELLYGIEATLSGVKLHPVLRVRLDLEPFIQVCELKYIAEHRVLTAHCYDPEQRKLVHKMQYSFVINETQTINTDAPLYQLKNEWGAFRVSAQLGGQTKHSNVVQVGNMIKEQVKQPEVRFEGLAAGPGKKLKSMHRKKYEDKKPEPFEVTQRKTYPKDYVQEEFWEPPPHPYAPLYDYHTHFVFDEYMLTVVFYFDPYSVQAFIVNQQRDGSFILSETIPEVSWEQDQREAVFIFEFKPTDIGQYPHLLVDCWDLQFLIPLCYQPVQPNGASEDYTYFLQYYFQCPVTVLGLKSGNVTNAWFLQTPQVKVANDKMDSVINVAGAQAILPTHVIQQPPEHFTTVPSLVCYYYMTPYLEVLQFTEEYFLSDGYQQLLQENQVKLEDHSSFYVLVRIGSRIIGLYFTEQDQRDLAYLCLLQEQGRLYDATHVNGDTMRYINEFRDLDVMDDYVFPEQTILKQENGKFVLSKGARGVTMAVGNNEIKAVFPLTQDPRNVADLLFGVDQIEVLAGDYYGSTRATVFSGYQPDNLEYLEKTVWDILEGLSFSVEVVAVDLMGVHLKGLLLFKGETVTLDLDDTFGFKNAHLSDMEVFFGKVNGILITYGVDTYDLELMDATHYQVVGQLFAVVNKYYVREQ